MDQMRQALRKVRRRIALQQWIDYSVTALFYASLAACGWLLLARLFPGLGNPVPVAFALWAAAFVAAGGLAFWRRPTLEEAALAADLRLGLRERFTSSLQLAGMEGGMAAALHRDAQRHLDKLNVKRDFLLSPTPLTRWLVLPVVLFGAAYVLLPEMDLFGQREGMIEAMARQEARAGQAKRLQEVARVLEKTPQDPYAAGDATAQELEKLAKALHSGEISEKQAMARVSKLSEKLAAERREMQTKKSKPAVGGDANQLKSQSARDMAKALQQGDMKSAAEKLKEMQEQLKNGELSEEQKKSLAEDMKKLSEMLGGQQSQEMAQDLQNIGEHLKAGDMNSALDGLQAMEMSMADLSSALDQMAKLDRATSKLDEWQQDQLGPSKYCRDCGKSLKPCEKGKECEGESCEGHQCAGTCADGKCSGTKPGSGKRAAGTDGVGHGQGNQTGVLPDDANATLSPTVLSGEMTQGKLLADMIQRAAPDVEQESTVDVVDGSFVQVQREAEQALTKEEIPAGSKEFVRQYFGTLEPNGDDGK